MNRKFKSLCLTLCIIPICNSFSQSYSRLNNFWDQLYTINSASFNDDYFYTLMTAVRKQWINFPGSPRIDLITATAYLDDYYSQFGVKLFHEPKGVTQKTDIGLSYAYRLLLLNNWRLNMGLGINFQTFSYDVSELSFPTSENSQIYDRMIFTNKINANLGLELNYFTWKIGCSSQNLISAFDKSNDLHPMTNIGYVYYRQQNNDWVNWGGGISVFQYNNIFQSEMTINTYVKETYENEDFQIGLLYRTWREIGLIGGLNFGAFNIRLSYDYNLGLIRHHSYGTAELMLMYKFNHKQRCRNCGWK